MNSRHPDVKLLWTGGWDSSYRLISLSKKKVTIQPYYIDNGGRRVDYELRAMNTIQHEVEKRESTRCIINDLIIVKREDIQKVSEIEKAFFRLKKLSHLGGQYIWLAYFAKLHNDIEIGVEDEGEDAFKYGELRKKHCQIIGDYYAFNQDKTHIDLYKVFGKFRFPLMYISKKEMYNDAVRHNFIDLMHKTWFCHYPINNQACGLCTPCVTAMERGMSYRLCSSAKKRYKIRQFIKKLNLDRLIRMKGIKSIKDIILRSKK